MKPDWLKGARRRARSWRRRGKNWATPQEPVLISIQEQCGAIFEAWRKDLAALVREVAEKGTGLVIRAERAEVLAALLDQSMRALLDKRSFSVRVNPEDADLVADILSDARHVNSRVSVWETVRDPSLEPGSLVVESESRPGG